MNSVEKINLSQLSENLFAPDTELPSPGDGIEKTWDILVVDDEPDVFQTTRLALTGKRFEGRSIVLKYAASALEAKKIIERNETEFAVILLDVVMESEHAGLDFAKWLREENGNYLIRIILRTGQPGQAPEEKVIIEYEIDDYKAKAQITSQKLYVSVISALRAYRSLHALNRSRIGLQRTLDASANLFDLDAFEDFAKGILQQIQAIINIDTERMLFMRVNGKVELVASEGGKEEGSSERESYVLEAVEQAFESKCSVVRDGSITVFVGGSQEKPAVVYVESAEELDEVAIYLIDLFCQRIGSGFETSEMLKRLKQAHNSTVAVVADLVEYKDDNTGEHVLRVAKMSRAIASQLLKNQHYTDILDADFIHTLGYAAILHDVGKVAVPDEILKKPGKLTDNEWVVMKTHSQTGGEILERNIERVDDNEHLKLGAEIAYFHHERWDGNGYPIGMKEEAIPLSARITSVADVYDALIHERCYKKAWPKEMAVDLIISERGKAFDPHVVDAFVQALSLSDEEMAQYSIRFDY